MKQWSGLRDDLTVVSEDGLLTAQNVSFKVGGESRRRPGLADRIDEAGTLVTEWTDAFGTPYLIFNSGAGTLRSVKISDGTETTLASGLATARGCFARNNGRVYFTNDFNVQQRIQDGDQSAGTAGIDAPSAAIGSPSTATGLCTAGVHGFRYRYYDSKSLYMSDPSDELDVTLSGTGSAVTFSIGSGGSGLTVIRSTDSKVDQVIIEMTDAGSSTFYRAATVNQTLTGTSISMTDTTLRLQVTAARDGDFGHQRPPLTSMVAEHRGRLFAFGSTTASITGVTVSSSSTSVTVTGTTMSTGWAGRLVRFGADTKNYRIASMSSTSTMVLSETYSGTSATVSGAQVFSATPDMLYWSRAGFPESWHLTNFARRVLQGTADVPSGLTSHHEVLYVFGQRTIRQLDYASDPASGQLVTIPTEMGLWNKNCLVECNGRLYGWCRSGAWTLNGLIPQHLSKSLDAHIDGSDPTSTDNVDASKYEQFHGVYDPRERAITWFYCTSSETYPKHAIVYDIDTKNWSTAVRKQSIRASCLTTGGTTNPTRALLADENGYSWYMTAGQFDGVPAVMSGGVVTVANTGSTTTIVNVSEALPTGTSNLNGVVAVYSSQERLVSSNTASTITLATALSAAPTIGTEMFLGEIDYTIRTKWFMADGFNNKKRPSYLMIVKVPGTASGKLNIRVFLDFSTTPFVYTRNSADTTLDGVTITNNSATVQVDLDGGSGDGVTFVPLPYLWHRVISVEIASTRPQNLLKIMDFQWIFKDPRSTTPVEDE